MPFFNKPLSEIISSWLGYLAYGILFLLFAFMPSVVMPELPQSTQTGKFFVFVYAMILVGILFLLQRLFNYKIRMLPAGALTPIDILLGILFLYITINRYLLQEVWGFSLRYYELIGLGVLYILLRQMDKKKHLWFLLAIMLSGIIQTIYGNLQLYGFYPSHHSSFRMTGSFFNPGPYAGFLASVFPVALSFYLFKFRPSADRGVWNARNLKESKSKLDKIYGQIIAAIYSNIPLIGMIFILLVLPASRSRAAILAVAISTLYLLSVKYCLMSRAKLLLNTALKRILVLTLIIGLAIGSLTALYYLKKESADGRLLVWKTTIEMIKAKPLFGYGHDRFKAEYMNYQAAYFESNPNSPEIMLADNVYYTFNELLQFTAENGLIGFCIVAIILFLIFTSKDRNEWIILSKAGILAFITFSMFSYPVQILPIKLNLTLFIAIAGTCTPSVLSVKFLNGFIGNLPKGIIRYPLIAFLLIGCLFIGLKANALKNGYKIWNEALSIYQVGAYESSLKAYQEAYPLFYKEGDFLMNYGKALSMAGEHQKATVILKKAKEHLNTTIIQTALGDSYKALKNFKQAETAYIIAGNMVPSRFYPKYLLAKLYDENNQKEKAREIALEIMDKEVKVASMAIEEIKAEMERILTEGSSK